MLRLNTYKYIHTYIHHSSAVNTYIHTYSVTESALIHAQITYIIQRSTHCDSLNVAVGGEDDEYPGQAPGHQHLSGRAPAAAQGQAGRREYARPDHDAHNDGDAVDHAKLTGPCCLRGSYCLICYDKLNHFSKCMSNKTFIKIVLML